MRLGLLLNMLMVVQAINIGGGFSSQCFSPSFESTFDNPSSRGTITIGVTAIVETARAQQVDRRTIQRSIDASNVLWRPAGIAFGDLQVVTSDRVADTRGGQHDGFLSYMKPVWEREARRYNRDRLVVVFAHVGAIGSTNVGGALFGGVGGMTAERGSKLFVWMNINGPNRRNGPMYLDKSWQHELGHGLGLFHTFRDTFGCQNGDYIADTAITPLLLGGSCNMRAQGCDGLNIPRDTQNLMSYGGCNGATRLTPGQLRRVRCALETHLPWRPLGGPRAAPTGNTPDTPATPARPPVAERPQRQLPGEGEQCLGGGFRGQCFQPSSGLRCTSGRYIDNACASASLRCCVIGRDASAGTGVEEATSLHVTTAAEAIKDEDIFPLPNEFAVYHVGDTVVATAHVAILNPKIYVIQRTEIHILPTQDELDLFGVQQGAIQDTNDEFVYHVPLNNIDRGSYAIYVVGQDKATMAQRGIVSEVFVVDVNSCKLQSNHNVPYGLVRSRVDCNARSGTVDHTVDGGLVCCVPEIVNTDVVVSVEPTDEQMATIMGQMGNHEEGIHAVPTPAFKAIGEFQWTGATSFWGAPMTVTPTAPATEPFDLHLIQAGSEEDAAKSMPAPVYSSAQSAAFTITPKVGTPLTAVFATGDLNGHTDSFSVVSLPCRLASGQAGYCRPTAPIFGGLGGATPEELICSAGEAGQCAGLAVDGVTFSCCAGSSSALQQAAVYRERKTSLENASSSIVPTLFTFVLLMIH